MKSIKQLIAHSVKIGEFIEKFENKTLDDLDTIALFQYLLTAKLLYELPEKYMRLAGKLLVKGFISGKAL